MIKRIVEQQTDSGFILVEMKDLHEGDKFRMFESSYEPVMDGRVFTALTDGREADGVGIIDIEL